MISVRDDEAEFRPMSIGDLARKTGVSAVKLRYYEREGLLPHPRRGSSGYREYGAEAAGQVSFILRAKALGFSLEEIADLLNLSADAESGVAGVKARASRRLAEIEKQIAHLDGIRARLASLVSACPGHGPLECCPILSAIRDGGGDDLSASLRSCARPVSDE
ncbi:MAG: heavy metal-responsive transcriptional regulator [Candidatus Accumulibacter sp.]|jgi:MerR family copper efflux transcriptional regulator|nr:heavy metal-responsive transcriptional regulator [Accumulibacter sp.]